MSASLVGSEMCIRDRPTRASGTLRPRETQPLELLSSAGPLTSRLTPLGPQGSACLPTLGGSTTASAQPTS
eukprot:10571718-Alexandrium_andersonii.AAC.1